MSVKKEIFHSHDSLGKNFRLSASDCETLRLRFNEEIKKNSKQIIVKNVSLTVSRAVTSSYDLKCNKSENSINFELIFIHAGEIALKVSTRHDTNTSNP